MRLLCSLILLFSAFPALGQSGDPERGRTVYVKRCLQCHGEKGGGDGSAADFMFPRPRVFADNSIHKIRTTPSGELPTDQDLFDIITLGLPGTAMPPFDMIPEQGRWDVVAYVKSLCADFTDPDFTDVAVPIPEIANAVAPPSSPEAIERGRVAYQEVECFKCHGAVGRGDGVSWNELSDDFGELTFPANLANSDSFRGGSQPFDLFRTITAGMNGTPMPSFADSLSVEQRWDLVHYVRSLAASSPEASSELVLAVRVVKVATGASDRVWAVAPPSRFKTLANTIEAPRRYWTAVEYVTVQAMYDADELALRIQWDDRDQSEGSNVESTYSDRDGKVRRDTDHPDQLAIQFPARHSDQARPYFLFGDRKKGVTLWWWRSDTDAVEVVSGKGFERLKPRAYDAQNVHSSVTWEDGRYTMLVRRALTTAHAQGEVQFEAGRFEPIALSVWDGSRGEVGQRRAVTTWNWLYLDPPSPKRAMVLPPLAFLGTVGFLLLLARIARKPEEEGAQ